MNQDQVRQAFEEHGVLMTGHFKLSSGRHSDTYLQKQRVFEYPRLTVRLGQAICDLYQRGSFTVVVSPAVGAIPLGVAVAYAADCRFLVTEREGGEMTLRRGQRLLPEDRALVVEDIITTGGSAADVVALIEASGIEPVGVAALADRSQVPVRFDLKALLRVEARDWAPEECPLCADGVPLDSPGSRYLTTG